MQMLLILSKFLFIVLTVLLNVFVKPILSQDLNMEYLDGISLINSSNHLKGLEKWEIAYEEYKLSNLYNSAMGIQFTEFVTKYNIVSKYNIASEMFLWSLGDKKLNNNNKYIISHAYGILPLLNNKDKKIWEDMLNDDNNQIITKIKEFWNINDPNPFTNTNERLVEHWERIDYASKTFKRKSKKPYKTDDRGIIYVRFGEPTWKYARMIGLINPPLREAGNIANDPKQQTARDFEIWRYFNLDEDNPVVFMFGEVHQDGFREISGVEDLIENSKFRTGTKSLNAFIPTGTRIQLLYYNELFHIDKIFSDRWSELESEILRQRNRPNNGIVRYRTTLLKSKRNLFKNSDKHYKNSVFIPDYFSTVKSKIGKIETKVFPIRYLNNGDPKIVLLYYSYPSNNSGSISLNSKLVIYNEKWKEEDNIPYKPQNVFDYTSIFDIEHLRNKNYVFASAVVDTDTTTTEEILFKNLGSKILKNIEPLNGGIEELEISDLVIGNQTDTKYNLENYPFPFLPTDRISKNDKLNLYFELYNLYMGPNGTTNYNITYSVIKSKRKTLLNIFKNETENVSAQTLTTSSKYRSSKERIVLDINKLKKGKYELSVEIIDNNSNKKITRSQKFVIF